MDWVGYWCEVLVASFNWIIELYPIPTLVIGGLITVLTAMGFWLRGKREEAHNIAWGLVFGLVACALVFGGLVLVWGPYIHIQQREKQLQDAAEKERHAIEASKANEIKALNETVTSLRAAIAAAKPRSATFDKPAAPLIAHDRDRLCEKKVLYKLTERIPHEQDTPYDYDLTLFKPKAPLVQFFIVANQHITLPGASGQAFSLQNRGDTAEFERVTEVNWTFVRIPTQAGH